MLGLQIIEHGGAMRRSVWGMSSSRSACPVGAVSTTTPPRLGATPPVARPPQRHQLVHPGERQTQSRSRSSSSRYVPRSAIVRSVDRRRASLGPARVRIELDGLVAGHGCVGTRRGPRPGGRPTASPEGCGRDRSTRRPTRRPASAADSGRGGRAVVLPTRPCRRRTRAAAASGGGLRPPPRGRRPATGPPRRSVDAADVDPVICIGARGLRFGFLRARGSRAGGRADRARPRRTLGLGHLARARPASARPGSSSRSASTSFISASTALGHRRSTNLIPPMTQGVEDDHRDGATWRAPA
jgi:hypothetical protein